MNKNNIWNDCTRLELCDGWKCLCDNMLSENDYCERYAETCYNE